MELHLEAPWSRTPRRAGGFEARPPTQERSRVLGEAARPGALASPDAAARPLSLCAPARCSPAHSSISAQPHAHALP